MPNNIKISEMAPAEQLNTTDLLMVSQQDAEVETEYDSKSTSVAQLAGKIATGVQFTSELDTDSKTIAGAINEAAAVGKKSGGYTSSSFTAVYDWSTGYQWEDSGETIDGHKVYRSSGGTYQSPDGDSVCTFTVEGYNSVTFYVKQDGATSSVTNKAYLVMGNGVEPVSLQRYRRKFDGDVFQDFESYTEYCYGLRRNYEFLYHVDPTPGPGTCAFDGNNGQWIDSGETVDGHTVYKSDAGSYGVYRGTSKCTLTLNGVKSISLYCKSGNYYGPLYAGELDTAIDTSDSDTYKRVVSEDPNYVKIDYVCADAGEHTLEVLFMDRDGNGLRGYFYYTINEVNTNRGYVYMVLGEPTEPKGEIFNDYTNNIALGYNSHAEGSYSKAYNSGSHAEVYNTQAIGEYSHAEGYENSAYGESSHVEGGRNQAYGEKNHAEGVENIVYGSYAHAEGQHNKAVGSATHAEGYYTLARDSYAHAEGQETQALGSYSHAEGYRTIALYTAAHAEGYETQANGSYAHSEGQYTQANSAHCHSEGYHTTANYGGAHAEGCYTLSDEWAAHSEGSYTEANGEGSHAEGYGSDSAKVIASGDGSHAEGYGRTDSSLGSGPIAASGKGAHAEGTKTTASGNFSHAEGVSNEATMVGAHAEGNSTHATGMFSHAEGFYTVASGQGAHAEGHHGGGGTTTASGNGSHAEGSGNTASGHYSHAEGTRNFVYSEGGHAEGSGNNLYGHEAHIEGSGNKGTEYSSHTEGAGNSNIAKNAHMEGGGNSNVSMSTISHTEGAGNTNYGAQSHIEGAGNTISGNESHVEGGGNVAHGLKSHVEGGGNGGYGIGAHVEGKHNTAFGYAQHAEGAYNIAGYSSTPQQFDYNNDYAEGDIVCINNAYYGIPSSETDMPFIFRCITAPGKIQSGNGVTIIHPSEWSASTTYSQGDVVKVSGYGFYKANSSSVTSNPVIKHSDNGGNDWTKIKEVLSPFKTTSSSGYYLLDCRDVYGSNDIAIVDSGAEVSAMWEPISTSLVTHVEGLKNIATGNYQHVQGKYNAADSSKAFIIGNGTADDARSNALTVDWSGNMTIASDLSIGHDLSVGRDITVGTRLSTTAQTLGAAINEIVAGGGGGGSSTLAGLTDVSITTPSNDDVLKYDSTSQKWVSGVGGGSGSSTLVGLTDVSVTTPSNGQALIYDYASAKWVNGYGGTGPSTLAALSDVSFTAPSDKQSLVYDSQNQIWKNAAINYNDISNTPSLASVAISGDYTDLSNTPTIPDGLADLTDDVNITSPSNGQILKYDGATSKWINGTGGGGTPWTDITGTLIAGQTSITLSNAAITTSSTIDYYTDTFGVNPTNVSVVSGSITLTFEAQSTDLGIKVRVS